MSCRRPLRSARYENVAPSWIEKLSIILDEQSPSFRPLNAQQIIIELDESSSKLLICNTSITSQSDKMSEDRGNDKKRKFPNARMQHGSNGGGRKGRDLGRKEWRYVLHTLKSSGGRSQLM